MSYKNRNEENKGITLIVLIITILVMLILAGVVINYAIGEGGLIGRAEDATNRYQNAEERELATLNRVDDKYDSILNRIGGGDIEEIPLPSPTEPTNPNPTTSPNPTTNPTTPPSGGSLEDIKGGDKFDNTTTITDKNEDEVTIPGGFHVTEDSADEVNKGVVVADENGNEFVWVPVPDPTTMYTEETVTLSGVEVTTSRYSKLRGSGFTTAKPGSSGYREPDVLKDTSYGDFNSTSIDRGVNQIKYVLGIAGGTDEEILKNYATALVEEYNAMIESVIKYKGFYIGRYEITGTVDSPTSKRGASISNQNWYNLKKACSNVVNNQSVKSAMIYGCQWDETLSWIVWSGAKSNTEVNSDSRGWGNYKDSIGDAATNKGSKQDTGSSEAWKANNIYDLAGNCSEWTQEAYGTYDRLYRGRCLQRFWFELSFVSPQHLRRTVRHR